MVEIATPQGAGARVAACTVVGAVVGAGVAVRAPWQAAVLGGWAVAALVFLVTVWRTVWGLDREATSTHARREDSSRGAADLMILTASVACLVGLAFALIKATQMHGISKALLVGLSVLSIVLSWGVVHTVFTLRYARLYYAPPVGGVDFNDKERPEYRDFAYLAATIGMTYQVSDTDLQIKAIRHTALRHALLSYLFGTGIIAMTINVVAGLLK